jgi:hypothetical protein
MFKGKHPTSPRRTYLLSTFQSKFALTFALLSGVPVLLTLFLIYRFVQGSGGATSIIHLLSSGSSASWLIGAVSVLFSSFLILFSVGTLMLHRVAGPVHIMSRYMSELAEGRYPAIRGLRRKDELVDFYLCFKQMAEQLRQHELEESAAIKSALEALGQPRPSAPHHALIGTLKAMLERKLNFCGQPKEQSASGTLTLVKGPGPLGAEQVRLSKSAEE